MKRWQDKAGFTIVELLIVIVVIAILAAITIVTFNGIQERAKNAQALVSVDSAEKTLRAYHALHGNYPETLDPDTGLGLDGSEAAYACLGRASDYPAQGAFGEGECYVATEGATRHVFAKHSATISEKLENITGGLSIDVNSATLSVADGSGSAHVRGVLYFGYIQHDSVTASVLYFTKGDRECGRGEKEFTPPGANSESPPSGMTVCTVGLSD